MFEWHKKERPFLGIAGMGGGVASRLVGGAAATYEQITFYLWGAGGGTRADNGVDPTYGKSGAGGYLEVTTTSVAPTDTLYFYVGNPGFAGYPTSASQQPTMLFAGGTAGGTSPTSAGGGGGAAYVSLNGTQPGPGTLLAVAGGGGGTAYYGGGGGGGSTGGTGGTWDSATGGAGGTQVAGGSGGTPDSGGNPGTPGSYLQGGAGATPFSGNGAGGGGGYYGGGGGGGASTNSSGGGGGGSNYANPAYMSITTNTQGAGGGSSTSVTNPSPYIDPQFHSYGAPYPIANSLRTPTNVVYYGGRARIVATNGTWTRTFNYSNSVESIPANYSPYGLDFTISANSPVDGPYDYGVGWGDVNSPGAVGCSIANSGTIYYEFTFSGPNSAFTNFEVWTNNANGLTNYTGSFNGGAGFSFPTRSPIGVGQPSGNLAPYLPGGNVTSFRITHGPGSGNSHLFITAMKINGNIVDFGRNLM